MATAKLLFLLVAHLTFSLSTTPSLAGMPGDELRAVVNLVEALLADPSWAELHPQPCTDTPWPGIQCETAGTGEDDLHVTGIHIGPDVTPSPPCKATAFLPPDALTHLPFIKTLSFFGCFLSPNFASLPPSLFSSSSSLEQLVLNSNDGLGGEIPRSISNLKSLRVLSLSQNAFHGGIPRELGDLSKLQQLDLSYNSLRGEIPEEMGGLTSLGIIDLSSNELQGNLPASIGKLHALQKIDLSFNSLSGRVPPELGELENLVLLDLSHNKLTGLLPEELSGMKQVQYFLMEDNPLNTKIPFFLANLKNLVVIGFSGCGLFGPIPPFLGSLVSLTALSLDRNMLNGSMPESLGFLPKLGQLNLSQNQLTGEINFSEEFVRRLGSRLDVRDNRGLCANGYKYQEASFNLEAPPCSSSSNGNNSGNSTWGVDNGKQGNGHVRFNPALDTGRGASLETCLGFPFGPSYVWIQALQSLTIAWSMWV
ncbi:hypothetical protein HPP92_026836 [Vanilla planifolia]|uniref:Disease resistance R13L4/SHOC-2-like LRR domain-containing protein n=1 Tax=Vanilla planifolia TaxID=51239 RepID=A0A835PBJ2_VANPL|nr:hypothetical protein HPP92_026836 [Vanilla planifolia]